MKYYLDCEFDGWMGALLSMALVAEDGAEFYWCIPHREEANVRDDWVRTNVLPILECEGAERNWHNTLSLGLEAFLARSSDGAAHIVVDWPDDVAYFCRAMITGPGVRIETLEWYDSEAASKPMRAMLEGEPTHWRAFQGPDSLQAASDDTTAQGASVE